MDMNNHGLEAVQPLMFDLHFILFIFVVELDQRSILFHMESLYHEIKFIVEVKL